MLCYTYRQEGEYMENYMFENKHYKTLNIINLGHQKCPPLHSYSYALPNFYLIHYVVSGCGKLIKNKVEKKVKAGEMFIIKPENVYTYTADKEDPWEYIWISFDGDLSSIFKNLDDIMKIDGEIFHEMLQAGNLKNTQQEFLLGKLYTLISMIFEKAPAESNFIKMVSDFIKANYAYKLHVADIAETINLNSRYLSRIFKQQKGVTIQEYIIKYKVKKAQSLLDKGFNVCETARAVGYEDAFTFSKIFKKYTGISPTKYKTENTKTLT